MAPVLNPSPYRWAVLGAATSAQAAFSGVQVGLLSVGPSLRSAYELSGPGGGLVAAAVTAGTLPTLVGWGVLADRLGERASLAVGMALSAVALMAAGRAAGAGGLVAALLLVGATGASAVTATSRAVLGWFGPGERALALGIRQSAIPAGALVAALVLPPLAAAHGLAAVFSVLAVTVAITGLGAAWLIRSPPADGATPVTGRPPVRPVRDPRLWRLACGAGLLMGTQFAVLAGLPGLATGPAGASERSAGRLVAVAYAASIGARVWAGRRSDRTQRRIGPVRTVALVAASGLLAAAVVAGPSPGAAVAVLLGSTVALLSWNGLVFAAAAELVGPSASGEAIAVLTLVLYAAGAIAPVLFGVLVDALGWPGALGVLAAVPALARPVLAPLRSSRIQPPHQEPIA